MGDRHLVVVIGLPELGYLLEDGKPDGADVVTIAAGADVNRRLADEAKGATRENLLCVVADTGDPAVNRLPSRLARGGFRVLVLSGLAGADGTFEPHANLRLVAAPFTADDVLVGLSALPGDVPFFLPIEGGDRVFGDRDRSTPAHAPPDIEAVIFGGGDQPPAEGDTAVAPEPAADDDPLGPPVAGHGSWPRPAQLPAWAEIASVPHAPPAMPGQAPGWVAHPYAASGVDPTPPHTGYADRVLHGRPVIDGDPLPPSVPPGPRRRGEVLSICSYKGGSGKCLTGDAVITDPVTGLPRRIDALVHDPDAGSVLTLDAGSIRAAPVAARIDSGVQATLRVELRSGRSVTATPHHPLLMAGGWRRVDQIAPGEAVSLAARIPFPERPHRMAPSELDWLATLVAGGRGAGPVPVTATTMPRAVFRLPEDQLERFIAVVWMFDGKVMHEGPPEITLASESLARSLQHLLLRFGAQSRVTPVRPPGDGDPPDAWRIILHPDGIAPFLDVLALRAGARRHGSPVAPGLLPRHDGDEETVDGVFWDEVVSVTPAGEQQVWDLTVEPTHCFVANDVIVHNTTTAVLAAATLARAVGPTGKRIALVDANTVQSSVSTVLRRPARGTILDLARTDVDERLLAAALTPIDDMGGLDVLFGAPDLRRADGRLLTPALYRRIVATLRRTHDYVLVDTPVAEAVDHELFDDFVLRDSDRVLVVLDPNRETVQNNAEWLDIVGDPVSAGGRNVPAEKIGIVLNRAQDDGTWDAEAVSRYFRRYQFLGVVPQSAAVQQAADEGRLLEPFDPAIDRAVRRALAAVVDEPLLTADPERAGSGIDRFLARLFRR
jgi:MinD-like ATPase involved in chromosome partitioning or flagellar assembly